MDERFDAKDYLAWVERGGIAVSGYPRGIRTLRVYEHPTTNKWVAGFVGRVHFDLPKDSYSEKYALMTNAILRFAEHSNVGGDRTAGLGVVHYQPIAQEKASAS